MGKNKNPISFLGFIAFSSVEFWSKIIGYWEFSYWTTLLTISITGCVPGGPLKPSRWKIGEHFVWLGMDADIWDYCQSCDIYQCEFHKSWVKPVLLKSLPLITQSFARVAIDIVGPLSHRSAEGHKYILMLIDFATGFPEAFPLFVTEALLSILSRVGVHHEGQADRDTHFTLQLMAKLYKLLGKKPQVTTVSSQQKQTCRETTWASQK